MVDSWYPFFSTREIGTEQMLVFHLDSLTGEKFHSQTDEMAKTTSAGESKKAKTVPRVSFDDEENERECNNGVINVPTASHCASLMATTKKGLSTTTTRM